MRNSKNRSRSKGNRNRSVGNVVNRVFDSSGPEGKVRGTPQQIIDKYNQLARDAQLGNDRVAAENFQQHAEHYTRLLGEAQRELEAKREQQSNNGQRPRNQGGSAPETAEQADAADTPVNAASQADNSAVAKQDDANAAQSATAQGTFGEVIEPEVADSGLVETPEGAPKPKRPRRRRKPVAEETASNSKEGSAQDEGGEDQTPSEAAE